MVSWPNPALLPFTDTTRVTTGCMYTYKLKVAIHRDNFKFIWLIWFDI